jgi:hypothetical protein
MRPVTGFSFDDEDGDDDEEDWSAPPDAEQLDAWLPALPAASPLSLITALACARNLKTGKIQFRATLRSHLER